MNSTPAHRPSGPDDHGGSTGDDAHVVPNPFEVLRSRMRTGLMVQGALAVLAGLLFLLWPIDSAVMLIRVFAAWLLLSAAVSAVLAVKRRRGGLAGTLLPALLGLALLLVPEAAGAVAVFVFAFLALLVGSTSIAASFGLRRAGVSAWWAGLLAGAAAAVYGFLLLLNPTAGLTGLLWVLGLVLVVIGAALLVLGWKVGKLKVRSTAFGAGPPGAGFGPGGFGAPGRGFGGEGFPRGEAGGRGAGGGTTGGGERPHRDQRRGDDDDVIPGEEA
ncbi:DUF308 domain-containing protein [Brevibacterium album]|uniref:DUF308 domain-containing protein n=1 Tax=Brevibacterium album TaxID=417948 RepID=UPI000426CCA7|nr:DUF308 domain-containing protein [Brevibacterium album]